MSLIVAATVSSVAATRLRDLKVGVQLIGDDGANSPPSHSLSRRGLANNLRGYSIYGDYEHEAPQSAIVEAVANSEVDVAFVWGPTAGYFAARHPVPLTVTPILPRTDGPALPMVFDISMGVRREDRELKREVEAALQKRADEIRAILVEYGVPLVVAD